ncbi:hypothetical protein LF887_02800 [Chryseobacterium sp. MEBOG06]|uniref:hypothetical protein n=1 Tax=Chryseobacterium sp. MEBOG06 TaxID=2879938 RepID=UPI001F36623B|nr:hypothetical protein [Chryseobacterium sp. MEBOG06]UKB84600.1 hypothetical protein LF887_02800 [Chryseobacterium sp. MEBOG06]
MNRQFLQLVFLMILCLFSLASCRKKKANYISYYQKVNNIDSIYRLAGNSKLAVEKYKELFKEYSPKNQERIEEYATYIILADQYHEDFGGKKSLYHLISLVAPYDQQYQEYVPLFKKYGIDSIAVQQKIKDWKSKLNKQLIDSFQVAFKRDQQGRPFDTALTRKNVEKNARLFKWTFENFGFPSKDKIGSGPMLTLVSHMAESKALYPYLQTKILEYVKSGDCPPLDYSMMVDAHNFIPGQGTYYGMGRSFLKKIDSSTIDKQRKSLGLPTLKHTTIITKDFLKKIKVNDTNLIKE